MIQFKIQKRLILLLILLKSLIPAAQTPVTCDFFTVPVSSSQASDGQIDLRILSGDGPFLIYWSHGDHQENISQLSAGDYTCTIVDNQQVPHIFSTRVASPEPFNWTYVNTGENHTILVLEGTIVNIPFDIGDVLGVFYFNNGSLTCGGYSVWDSGNFAVSAWGNNGMTPEKDGFDTDEAFIFGFYDQATQRTYFLQSDFQELTFPNSGKYSTNGMSGIAQVGNITQEIGVQNPVEFSAPAKVYPNPCQDVITISLNNEFEADANAWLISPEGEILKTITLKKNSAIQVHIQDLPDGIYFLRINEHFSQRILKISPLKN
jgi:hypothetical protein